MYLKNLYFAPYGMEEEILSSLCYHLQQVSIAVIRAMSCFPQSTAVVVLSLACNEKIVVVVE